MNYYILATERHKERKEEEIRNTKHEIRNKFKMRMFEWSKRKGIADCADSTDFGHEDTKGKRKETRIYTGLTLSFNPPRGWRASFGLEKRWLSLLFYYSYYPLLSYYPYYPSLGLPLRLCKVAGDTKKARDPVSSSPKNAPDTPLIIAGHKRIPLILRL